MEPEVADGGQQVQCRAAESGEPDRSLRDLGSNRAGERRETGAVEALIAALGEPFDAVLKTLQERSAIINHRHRLTGDALVFIIEEVLAIRGKIKVSGLQEALDAFIDSQVLIPGKWQPVSPEQLKSNTLKSRLLQKIQANLEEYKESI